MVHRRLERAVKVGKGFRAGAEAHAFAKVIATGLAEFAAIAVVFLVTRIVYRRAFVLVGVGG